MVNFDKFYVMEVYYDGHKTKSGLITADSQVDALSKAHSIAGNLKFSKRTHMGVTVHPLNTMAVYDEFDEREPELITTWTNSTHPSEMMDAIEEMLS